MSLRPPAEAHQGVGVLTGTFVSSRPLIALKSAVLAPMPSASDSRTTAVQPFAWSSRRTAWRRSLSMAFMLLPVAAVATTGGPPPIKRSAAPRFPGETTRTGISVGRVKDAVGRRIQPRFVLGMCFDRRFAWPWRDHQGR